MNGFLHTMETSKRSYGRITSRPVRLGVWLAALVGIAIFVVGAVMQWTAPGMRGLSFALLGIGVAIALYAFYLWIRLSD